MGTYTMFDESKGCNPGVPLNDVVEEIALGRIFPLLAEDGSPAVMPMEVASPVLASHVAAANPGGAMTNDRRTLPTLAALSKKAGVKPWTPPKEVIVPDIASLIAGRRVTVGKTAHPLNLGAEDTTALLAGQPVAATLPGTNGGPGTRIMLRPQRMLPTDTPIEVTMTDAQMAGAVATGKVVLPGFGEHPLKLGESHLRQFMSDGVAVVDHPKAGAPPIVIRAAPDDPAPTVALMARRGGPLRLGIPANDEPLVNAGDWLRSLHFQLAVYVPYVQQWKLLGYSRGLLVNTFALAPQEELTLETYTWDRTKTSTEDTSSQESEVQTELTLTSKSSFEAVLQAKKNEHWSMDAHAGLNLPSAPISASGNAASGGSLDTSNQTTVSNIREAVSKASNRLKSTRQVKITEAREFGREDRSRRVIRNANMCHTLHFDYFEVLENYEVTTSSNAANAKLCVLMDIPAVEAITNEHGLVAYEGFLRGKVPAALDAGFDAARKLVAQGRLCDYKCLPACNCGPAAAATGPTVTSPEQLMQNAADVFTQCVKNLAGATLRPLETACEGYFNPLANPKPSQDDWNKASQAAWRTAYRKVVMESFALRFWSACLDFAGKASVTSADVDLLVASASVQAVDVLNVEAAMNQLIIKAPVELAVLAATYPLAVAWLGTHLAFDNAGMDAAFENLKQALTQVKAKEAADAAATQKQELDKATAYTGLDDATAQALADASVAVEALVSYIRLNESRYKLMIWNSLEEVDKLRLLMVSMPGAAKYLLPNIVGMVGDKLAVEFNANAEPKTAKWLADYVQNIAATQTTTVSLPSPGVTMQTRLGQCDACEDFITESRKIELQRLQAVAGQQTAEAERRKMRLQKSSPDLSSFDADAPQLSVRVENPAP